MVISDEHILFNKVPTVYWGEHNPAHMGMYWWAYFLFNTTNW